MSREHSAAAGRGRGLRAGLWVRAPGSTSWRPPGVSGFYHFVRSGIYGNRHTQAGCVVGTSLASKGLRRKNGEHFGGRKAGSEWPPSPRRREDTRGAHPVPYGDSAGTRPVTRPGDVPAPVPRFPTDPSVTVESIHAGHTDGLGTVSAA